MQCAWLYASRTPGDSDRFPGIDFVIHVQCRRGGTRFANNDRWNSSDRAMGSDILQHHAAGSDLGPFADFDVAQNLRAGSDQNTSAYFGMTVTGRFACSPQSHFVQE
jgi:hypothetical protein